MKSWYIDQDSIQIIAALNAGEHIEARDEDGYTALLLAALSGNEPAVRTLLDRGADVHVRTDDDETALMAAVVGQNEAVFDLFLAAGVDPLAKNYHGWSAMCFAAQEGHLNIARKLLARGVSLTDETFDGYTPLLIAAEHGHPAFAIWLLEQQGSKPKKIDIRHAKSGRTALSYFSESGHIGVVQELLKRGADAKGGRVGISALGRAARKGHADVCRLLLKHGADVNAPVERPSTKSHMSWSNKQGTKLAAECAIEEDHVDVLKVLIESGARIRNPLKKGNDWLLYCAENDALRCGAYLIDSGLIAPDHQHLLRACRQSHAQFVEMLLARGVTVGEDQGYDVLVEAVSGRIESRICDVMDLLFTAGASPLAQRNGVSVEDAREAYFRVGIDYLRARAAQQVLLSEFDS